jgi:hypothetical protein
VEQRLICRVLDADVAQETVEREKRFYVQQAVADACVILWSDTHVFLYRTSRNAFAKPKTIIVLVLVKLRHLRRDGDPKRRGEIMHVHRYFRRKGRTEFRRHATLCTTIKARHDGRQVIRGRCHAQGQ